MGVAVGVRVAIDYTSAVHQRAGVGRYTRSLAEHLTPLLQPEDELLLWYASRSKDTISLPRPMHSGKVETKRIPISPRWAAIGWQRLKLPISIDRCVGAVDLHHEPDFVAPPSKRPVLTTIHDLSYLIVPEFAHPDLRRYLERSVPRTLERAHGVIAVSETTRRDVIERYDIDADRVTTIYNGVDSWFRAPDESAVERALEHFGLRSPFFIMVGTVEPRKNHLTALRAFASLYERRRDISLAIVGNPGWLSEPIVEEIEKASKSMAVRYLRFVDDTWIPALYAGSVGLLAPSWYEGFGLPVLEAMACGAAVITSDRGALPEVSGDAALIVAPGNVDELSEAMTRLLDDSQLRHELSSKGVARAASFTWEEAANKHLDLYRSAVASR
ncbi:MAG: glycosyltransferase family 1 protein [Nitrolancea sp.]